MNPPPGLDEPDDPDEPDRADTVVVDLAVRARSILEAAWRPEGFTSPNATTYPWQWLWDSCFHAIVWAHLGDERAVVELRSALAAQQADGFVPHVNYRSDPIHAAFWDRPSTSSITQPPMYGHALAELARLGFELPDELVERCRSAIWHLLRSRRPGPGGLVRLCHPWESGADDSPRWDHWCTGGFDHRRWFDRKGELVESIRRNEWGSPFDNPAFDVAPAGFNALIVFNGREIAAIADDRELAQRLDDLSARLDQQWDPSLDTWTDAGESEQSSGRVRTGDSLLPALCTSDVGRAGRALGLATDAVAYGGACGPAGVHRDESAYAPETYWRGPAWPQLTYLLWLAACRRGRDDFAASISAMARRGAVRSGFAEYWHPDTGQGLGAIPQSWSTLAAVMTAP